MHHEIVNPNLKIPQRFNKYRHKYETLKTTIKTDLKFVIMVKNEKDPDRLIKEYLHEKQFAYAINTDGSKLVNSYYIP